MKKRLVAAGQSHKEMHSLAKRYMWRCYYCRRTVHCRACEPDKDGHLAATRDHYEPRSKGGRDHGPNIVLACWLCNQEKADTEPRGRRDYHNRVRGTVTA